MFNLDPSHSNLDLFAQEITQDIWKDKYRYDNESHPNESLRRVARAIYGDDDWDAAYEAMAAGLWVPAGRIHAGAGTKKVVTLMNCYVCRTIDDSMVGIADALKDAMLTMQQGGGIGMDFSTLRPKRATLRRTGAPASGPLTFMDMWDAMCQTIMSAGSRRGAMMGTMIDSHPDLLEFIDAKKTAGRLTNFNLSILVSDAFMDAIRHDAEWSLYFHEPLLDGNPLGTFEDDSGKTQYVYSIHPARELWDKITETTYAYSEPGIIFIDRINELNNLSGIEDIRCTNPCGEQPLPPWACCNLGANNLARMVMHPFSPQAFFNFELLQQITKIGVEFLDKVIDVTNYPLLEQKEEELSKRRIGLGITGLASAFTQMGLRYGSEESVVLARKIMRTIANEAYLTSTHLARDKGVFPLYSKNML